MNAMNQVIRRVKGFFQLGERDAFTRIDELASLGEESLHLLVKILTNSPNGLSDIEACTNRISLLEKQGDKIVQSLEEMFGKGSISALLMREFERLADSVDGVLDRAHALSRQIRRVTKRPLREAKEFDAIIRKDQVRLIEIGRVRPCHRDNEGSRRLGKTRLDSFPGHPFPCPSRAPRSSRKWQQSLCMLR